jgi:hypothetical protein
VFSTLTRPLCKAGYEQITSFLLIFTSRIQSISKRWTGQRCVCVPVNMCISDVPDSPWWLFQYSNTPWPNLRNMYINEIKMTGESELVMKPSSKNVWCQDLKESIYGKTRWKEKSRRPNFRWLDCRTIWNRRESRDGGSKAEDRSVWAVVLKKALVKLWGSLANEEVNK